MGKDSLGGFLFGTKRSWRSERLISLARMAGSVLVGLIGWQVAVSSGVLPAATFPDTWSLIGALLSVLASPETGLAAVQTLRSAFLGLLVAGFFGVSLGIIIGVNKKIFHATRIIVEFLRPIPPVAVLPAAVLLLGTGFETKVTLVIYAAFFPILLQTIYGTRDVDPVALDTARSFRLGTVRRLGQVILPSALPYIITGWKISASLALLVSVSVEVIVGAPGLGQAITSAQVGGAIDTMCALVVVTGLIGVGMNRALSAITGRMYHWRPAGR